MTLVALAPCAPSTVVYNILKFSVIRMMHLKFLPDILRTSLFVISRIFLIIRLPYNLSEGYKQPILKICDMIRLAVISTSTSLNG